MQTVELNIDDIGSPKELAKLLFEKDLHEGDNLVLNTREDKIMFFLVILLFVFAKGKKKRFKESEEFLNNLFAKYDTAEELERDIEKEYGINIEVKTKNPLDEAFGLWRDNDINLETIRENAWRRKE
jgi:hypothetical protein